MSQYDPYEPRPGEQVPPPAVPPAQPQYPQQPQYGQPQYSQPQYGQPQYGQPYPADAPVPAGEAIRPEEPTQATTGTEDPRLGLEVGRFWAGAAATVFVCGLVGLVAALVIGEVLDIDMQAPPDLSGNGSELWAWTVAGALFALAGAVILQLLVLSTPRPRTFFGWVVALLTVILAALPFVGDPEFLPATMAALVWIVLGVATWSLLTGVLSRTLVRRRG